MCKLWTKIYYYKVIRTIRRYYFIWISISICLVFGLSVPKIFAGYNHKNSTNHDRSSVRTTNKVTRIEYYRDSRDMGRLLDSTRSQIYYQLSNYKFSLSGAHVLEDLVMESGGRPLRSLIISTWRSGTTFLGELLNAIPGTYYHYEPLLKYGIIQIRGSPESDLALSTIKHMLKCNYYSLDDYFKYGSKHEYQFIHNTRLWDHCKYKKDLCYDAEFTSRLCKLFPFHAMKVVRLRLSLIQEILDDKELNVKVILLIRDPRAVMQSRQHRAFCQSSTDCWDPSFLCANMISDYVAADRILQEYPDSLMVVRYEELAMNPMLTSHRILKFLRVMPTSSLNVFLTSHTNVEVAGVFSTKRVSREVAFKWKYILQFDIVDEIQNACKEAMFLWGYKMAHNKTHMTSKDFNPLTNYSISQ